jgi:hypothetical protein
MFTFETYIAFRRIGKPLDKGGEYLHATWEVTHTLLILSINYFVWLYSPAITAVAEVAFVSMLLFGAVFIIRAIIYTYLFYIKSSNKPNVLADWLFAVTHVIMAGCLIYTVLVTLIVMQTGSYEPNNTYLPLLWPGLILMVPLISLPLYFLYRTKQ